MATEMATPFTGPLYFAALGPGKHGADPDHPETHHKGINIFIQNRNVVPFYDVLFIK